MLTGKWEAMYSYGLTWRATSEQNYDNVDINGSCQSRFDYDISLGHLHEIYNPQGIAN
jgi:hypothetical protein